MKKLLFFFIPFLLISCKSEKDETFTEPTEGNVIPVDYANGFTLVQYDGYKLLTVKDPWPDAGKSLKYLLVEDGNKVPKNLDVDHQINIPVEKIAVTSTTHIPSLEALNAEDRLIGFPGLDFISSEKTRKRIEKGEITELGKNEAINTEILIMVEPELVIGFAVNGNNKTYSTIEKSGIPVIFNGDWTENSPLGKAEWIKFFGAIFNKSREAEEYFQEIVSNYEEARIIAGAATTKPVVLSGSMYKDQWYLPYGNSWLSQFIQDANATYIYEDSRGSGSMALAFETVLTDAAHAEFWIAPGQFTSYVQLKNSSLHYEQFKAVREKNVFTYNKSTGESGGVLFFELAPTRPDLVLKDLISIFHPELFPRYRPIFFQPLD